MPKKILNVLASLGIYLCASIIGFYLLVPALVIVLDAFAPSFLEWVAGPDDGQCHCNDELPFLPFIVIFIVWTLGGIYFIRKRLKRSSC